MRDFRELSETYGDQLAEHTDILKQFLGMCLKMRKQGIWVPFQETHFNPPGNELEECSPADWNPLPDRFHHIKDYHLRKWALSLHRIWKVLCRQVRTDVRDRQDHYSLLYVPNPFVIPGGRFREFYVGRNVFTIIMLPYFSSTGTHIGSSKGYCFRPCTTRRKEWLKIWPTWWNSKQAVESFINNFISIINQI